MKELSHYDARKIVLGALRDPILIITGSDNVAMMIRNAIVDFAHYTFSEVHHKFERYHISIGGFESITIMPLAKWTEDKFKTVHKGTVIVTSRQITSVPATLQQPILLDDYLKG